MIPCIFSTDNGRRLEPLTCSYAVPLLEICGKPVIEYTVDMLRKNGFSNAVVSTVHKKEAIEDYFSYNPLDNFSISYDISDIPDNEPVLLINADTLYSYSLENALKFHNQNNCDLTVITQSVSECSNYRAVFTDKDKSAVSFHDNPSYFNCISSADTGIYIVSPKIFRLITNSGEISAEFLNRLIAEKFSVFGYECTGYFCPINSIRNYMKCQHDILCNSVTADIFGHRTLEGNIIHGSCDLKNAAVSGLICIGDNVSAQKDTVIDGLSVIGNNVKIGKNSTIRSCIIMDGAYIGDGVTCSDAVIGRNAVLLNSSSVNENCIIGENAVIGENTVVKANASVWNCKNTGRGKTISYNLKYGHSFEIEIDENGICGETNAVITPHTALSAGISFGKCGKRFIIGYGSGNASNVLAHSFGNGIQTAGGYSWYIGECIPCEVDYAIKHLNADGGAYIQSGNITRIIPFAENGTPLDFAEQSALEYSINHDNSAYVPYNEYGSSENISVYRSIYFKYLNDIIPENINFTISVNSSDRIISELCRNLLKNREMKSDMMNSIVFNISSDGRKISAYSEKSGFVFHEKLIMLCCDNIFAKGYDIIVPAGASSRLNQLAEKYSRRISVYSGNEPYENFFADGLVLMAEVIRILSERNISLATAVDLLPDYASSSKFISIEKSPAEIMQKLYSHALISPDGSVISSKDGNVSIQPSRSGKSIMVYAEAARYETARELCDFIAENINQADIS